MIERRGESRFLCADMVRVDWLAGDPAGGGSRVDLRTAEAVLEDISALGACVQVEERIPPGAKISISVGSGLIESSPAVRFSGRVSYCVYRDYGYFAGIKFSDETRWSSGVFE